MSCSRDRLSLFYIFCVLFVVFAEMSAQEQYRFRHLNKEDGLSQSSVFSIEQDETGFLWFGTRDGLNKYDGYDFTVYRVADGLVNNDVRAIYHDSTSNQLWIGTPGGASKYDLTIEAFTNYQVGDSMGLSSNNIRCFSKGRNGHILIGTTNGLNYYDAAKNQFFLAESSQGNLDIRKILILQSGEIYLGTNRGIFHFDQSRDRPLIRPLPEVPFKEEMMINSMIETRAGTLWVGTQEDGAFHWNPQTNEYKQFHSLGEKGSSLNHNKVRTIVEAKDGNTWIGTFRGLNLVTSAGVCFDSLLPTDSGSEDIINSSIRDIYLDQRGAMWVGSYHGGLGYYDPGLNQFKSYFQRPNINSLSSDVVSSFQEDSKGNLWIGTEGGGLNYLDRRTGVFSVKRHHEVDTNSPSGDNIKALLIDSDHLWIGTYNKGLDRLNIRTGAFQHFRHVPNDKQSISSDDVYGLLKRGDELWIATYGGGLNLWDLSQNKMIYFQEDEKPGGLTSNLSRVIIEDQSGTLWIGTQHGLNRLVSFSRENGTATFKHYLVEKSIFSLYPATDGKVWVGTYSSGLFSIDPINNTMEHFTISEGLPGNTVFGILPSKNNELWLSTNNGIARLNLGTKEITSYDQSYGLRSLEYNFNAYHKLKSGELLFGGIRGFTSFNPGSISSNTYAPPVALTELRQFNKAIHVSDNGLLPLQINEVKKLEFPYNGASFSIGFAALDYFNPDANEYKYKLEGLDQNWTNSRGKSIANYSIQRPGDYLFRLRAANSEGVWNLTERQVVIVVNPPPWRSWWAYLLYGLLFLIGLYAAYHFIKLRQQYRFEQLANEQKESLNRAKLRFFTNIAHEFRTPLTLILGPLEDILSRESLANETGKKLRVVKQSASRLLDLVNQLLTFRKLEAEGEKLAAGPGNIIKFCHEIFLSFTEHARIKNIHFSFAPSASHIELYYDRNKLEKVLVNLLANAFKFTPEGGNIEVSVTTEEQNVLIKVMDNGVGIAQDLHEQIFKRFYEKEGSIKNIIKGSGIGLALSREMVLLHRGSIEVQSEVGSGSVFTISLPIGRAHLQPKDIIPNFKDSEQIDNYLTSVEKEKEPAQVIEEEKEVFSTLKSAGNLPKLLIVEDNPTVRDYIEACFEGLFSIKTAKNGLLGLDIAIANVPDLIISDVMMPEMDGISLCRELKKDERTSHIPIILLTARTAATFKLEGLEMGADDYVTKPFSPKELRLRARNILSSRLKIRNKLVRLGILEPKEIELSSTDEIFLEKAMALVEENIDQPDFNVEKFAREMAVSRAFLFAKLKAVTDHTPNNFVKVIRLKRAAQLLKEYNLEVSQVAYKVGFRDPRYFSKCFKKMYAVSPSEYHNNEGKRNTLENK